MEPTTFVGLDVHKRMTSVAIAEPGRAGEVRFMGEIASTPEALHRLVQRLEGQHRRLSFCYEAGPCGYGVHRLLSGLGQECKQADYILEIGRELGIVRALEGPDTVRLRPVCGPDPLHRAQGDARRLGHAELSGCSGTQPNPNEFSHARVQGD